MSISFPPFTAFYFGGGRHSKPGPVISKLVAFALQRGGTISVGCAVGADAQVIKAALAQGGVKSLRIHAVFNKSGEGGWQGSAVPTVQAASVVGAQVTWQAGGTTGSFAQQLMRRSIAGLISTSVGFFISPGRGSYKVIAQAIMRGVQVFVFSSPCQPAAIPGCPGTWQPTTIAGVQGWQFITNWSGPSPF
jgi:hypothetical protein